MFKKILKFLGVCLVFATPAFAQGYHYRDTVTVNAGGQVQVLGNATITVCQAGATGIPCSPTQNIYSNLALSTPITNLHSDVNGNFDFYIAPGNDYVYTAVSSNGSISASFVFTAPCIITGSACGSGNPPGGSPGQVEFNNSGSFGGVSGSSVTAGTGAILLTAGADTTTPLSLAAHSSTQSKPILDASVNSSTAGLGTINFRGFGTGKWSDGGGTILLHLMEDAPANQAPVGWVVSNNRSGYNSNGSPTGAISAFCSDVGLCQLGGGGTDANGNYSPIVFDAVGNGITVSNSENNNVALTSDFTVVNGQTMTTHDTQRWNTLSATMSGIDNLGRMYWNGSTSGTAKIGAPAVAGTPCIFLLPTTSPSAGQILTAAAPVSGACQTSWSGGGGSTPLSGTTSASHLSYASGSNIEADVAGSAVTGGTGAIALTAGADTTLPLQINSHSTTQSATMLDINNQAGSQPNAPLVVRGRGFGTFGPGACCKAILNVQAESVATANWPLVVTNRSAVGSGSALSAIGFQMQDTGVGAIFGGNAVGDGSGNFSNFSFHENQTLYGAASQAGSLAIALEAAGNGTTPFTIWRPLGTAGPAAANMLQIAVGTALGYPLAGFDSGGAAGTQSNVNLFFSGVTSGTAKIGVAPIAGTPCIFTLPTSSATAGQYLQSAAPSSGSCQTSWATAFTSCGTVAANGACSNTGSALGHCIGGIATLSTGTSTITGLSPAFTSSSSFFVTTNDLTTITNASKGVPASASSITFTGTGTDNISFVACGS